MLKNNESKGKEQNNELNKLGSSNNILSNDKKINNPVIYSIDTNNLFLLFSKNSTPVINELIYQKALNNMV